MPEKQTKRQKIADWIRRNQEALIALTTIGGVAGFATWLVIVTDKEQKQALEAYNAYAEEFNTWLNDQNNEGNAVYKLDDGRFLVTPYDTPKQIVIK